MRIPSPASPPALGSRKTPGDQDRSSLWPERSHPSRSGWHRTPRFWAEFDVERRRPIALNSRPERRAFSATPLHLNREAPERRPRRIQLKSIRRRSVAASQPTSPRLPGSKRTTETPPLLRRGARPLVAAPRAVLVVVDERAVEHAVPARGGVAAGEVPVAGVARQ